MARDRPGIQGGQTGGPIAVPMPTRASLERAIGAVLLVVSATGLVSGGILLGQRADIRPQDGLRLPIPAAATASPAPTPRPTPTGPVGPTAVLVGAGDIADCRSKHDDETADLLATIPGIVYTLGDNAYNSGSAVDFRRCYAPSWGRFRYRTRPAIGNHDVVTAQGAPYFAYFGSAAGDPIDGWYSYDAETWHVIVLNSNCEIVGGCGEGSRQLAWLKADLAAHPAECTVAIWHHPRFSSGAEHGNDPVMGDVLAGPVRRGRGARPERARPRLRAVRATGPGRHGRPGSGDPRVCRRNGRQVASSVRRGGRQFGGPQRVVVRRAQARPRARRLPVALPRGPRQHVQRQRLRRLPLGAARALTLLGAADPTRPPTTLTSRYATGLGRQPTSPWGAARMEHARAVIIGGGVGGTSVAYHLAELGWTDVVLVDRAELTSGSTFHSAGLVGQLRSSVTLTRMMMYGVELYRRLAAETGVDPVLARGRLAPARVDAGAPRGARPDRPAGRRRSGCRSSLISADRGAGAVPADVARRACSVRSTCRPTAGSIRRGWPRRWRPAPASAVSGSSPTPGSSGSTSRDGRVRGVRVVKDGEERTIGAEVVVNAGGMFAPEIGRLAGVNVPIIPMAHEYLFTERIDGVRREPADDARPGQPGLLPRGGRRAVHGRLRAPPGALVARRRSRPTSTASCSPRTGRASPRSWTAPSGGSRRSPTRASTG